MKISSRNSYLRLGLLFSLIFYYQSLSAQRVFKGVHLTKTYSSLDYQSGSKNWEVTKGKDGSMYFANSAGLLEFDGKYWQTYALNRPNNNLMSLLATTDGNIYVGGQGNFGFFSKAENGQLQYTDLTVKIDSSLNVQFDEVWDIYELENSEILFCSHNALFRYDGENLKVILPQTPTFYSYYVRGKVYANSWSLGLQELDGDSFKKVKGGAVLEQQTVRSIVPFKDDQLLIATLEGNMYLYDRKELHPWANSLHTIFENSMINIVRVLKDGKIAVGTQNNGLFIISDEGEIIHHFNKGKGLNDRIVYGIYQEKNGNLWLTHNEGISYVELNSPFTLFNENNGVEGAGYAAKVFEGQLYIGTSNGLFKGNKHPQTHQLEFEFMLGSQGQAHEIEELDGSLYYAQHNGAFKIKKDGVEQLSNKNGAWNYMKLLEDENFVLQGFYGGIILYEKQNKTWKPVRQLKGFTESPRLMAQDENHFIWASHGFKGVYRMKLNAEKDSVEDLRHYGKDEGFPSNLLINMYKINSRLIFCAESGIYVYDETSDRFVKDDFFNQLLGEERVSYMTEDMNGNIYFLQEGKLGYIQLDKFGNHKVERKKFFRINPMICDNFDRVVPIDLHNILITSKDGFIHYNPSFKPNNQKEYQVSIREIKAMNGTEEEIVLQKYLPEANKIKTINLPFELNNIELSFVAPNFEGSEFVEYQYILDGYDNRWSKWNKTSEQRYTNLREGTYIFKVRAKNIQEEVSFETSVRLIIKPPWYRSNWAILCYIAILLTSSGVGIYVVRSHYAREQQDLMEETQYQLTQKDGQIKQLQDEMLKDQIESKNRELTLSTMHLTQKNAFLSSLQEDLQKALKGVDQKLQQKELKVLIKRIEKDINDSKEWEKFEEHFDFVHGDFFKKIKNHYPDLTTQECKICGYIRMDMSTKDIANTLNMSVRGVETSRYRLKKKLGLEKEVKLKDFILTL
ncbi:triple tyrosine motif-containing protein [Sediminitomix flava]|uniref:Regulatory LuxR family protein n=1 Tax=Sediminitomix flava TaxID=379075 RepID=A0A315Z9G2_SEDFL|nr:triple tyrosine motif-containing protein [Sediminitomix flava]PWJ41912.1 regulatory LuxR family protein [Sediminitomix flava]